MKERRCPHVSKDDVLHWCDPCAEAAAGERPEPEYEPGDYVAVRGDSELGVVSEVRMTVHGAATSFPAWVETVSVRTVGGCWSGNSSFCEKLVTVNSCVKAVEGMSAKSYTSAKSFQESAIARIRAL